MTTPLSPTGSFTAHRFSRYSIVCALALSAAVSSGLAAGEMNLVKDVSFLEPGRSEKLDLYLPARGPDDPPVPAVVWIHGGGFRNSDKAATREKDVCESLAAAGYVCASVNYRLGDGAWPTNVYDCKNAVRYLRVHAAEYHVDSAHIAAMGGSAGGVLAQMVGFTTGEQGWEPSQPYPGVSSAVAAVGDFYGGTDFVTRQHPPSKAVALPPAAIASLEKVFSVPPGADPSVWRSLSPVSYVTRSSPPVLIMQGLADPSLGYLRGQEAELAQALSDNGIPHEIVMVARAGHGFGLTHVGKVPLSRDLRPVVIDFLNSCGCALPPRR